MKSILMALSFFLIAFSTYSEEVRPLSLTVLDAETGEPIPNVPVYYELLTAGRERFLLFFWKIDPVVYRPILRKTYITDNNGRVTISAESVSLRKHEQLFEEGIYINIDHVRDKLNKHDADVFFSSKHDQWHNPVSDYMGVILCTATRVFGSDQIRGVKRNKGIMFESIFVDNSLAKKSDAIEIQLGKSKTSKGNSSWND